MGWREDIVELSEILNPKWMGINNAISIGELFEKLRPQRLLEIGTLQGTGSCYIGTMAKYYGGSLITIDIPWSSSANFLERGFVLAESQIEMCSINNVEIIRREDGAEGWFLDYFNDGNRKPFDFIYIDGGHRWFNITSQMFCSMASLCYGGWIVVDDINHDGWPDVGVAWKQLKLLMGTNYEKNGQGFIRKETNG